jgi:hypothetical protein
MAAAVERRAAVRDKEASFREAARVAAALKAESLLTETMVTEHEHWLRANASFMRFFAEERHALALEETGKRHRAIETLSSVTLTSKELESLSEAELAERVRAMDNALIHLRALREIAQREADREQRERDRMLGQGRIPNST